MMDDEWTIAREIAAAVGTHSAGLPYKSTLADAATGRFIVGSLDGSSNVCQILADDSVRARVEDILCAGGTSALAGILRAANKKSVASSRK